MNTESVVVEFLTDCKTSKVGFITCYRCREKYECGISGPNSNLYQLYIAGDSEALILLTYNTLPLEAGCSKSNRSTLRYIYNTYITDLSLRPSRLVGR
jgi:hypothetical protein